jgi:DTW domain-containing protein YfiP
VALDESLVALERAPLQLIVPDGTWRQASKMHLRHPELRNVPRLKIGVIGDSTFQMRTQTRPEGMAT